MASPGGQQPETARGQAGLAGAGDLGLPAPGCADAGCQQGDDSGWRLWRILPDRFWFRGDYLMWWTNGTHLPPLVTTGANGALPQATILFGDQTVERDNQSGFHATAGVWLDACQCWDLEFDYFTLGQDSANFSAGSDANGNPLLARPIYDVSTLQESRELVSSPVTPSPTAIALSGAITVNAHDYFQSAGVLLSRNLYCCNSCGGSCDCCGSGACDCCGQAACGGRAACSSFGCRVDLLGGYRYYNLSDSVAINENLLGITPLPIANVNFLVNDSFRADNEFHGADLGVRTTIDYNRWSLELLGKFALGDSHDTVTIGGQTVIAAPGQPPLVLPGGVLALATNSGTFVRDSFTAVPQLELNLGYQLTCHWSAHVGYDLLYWGTVQRAADQISLDIDSRNVPFLGSPGGSKFPVFPDKTSSFWAQGFNLGTEVRF